MFIQDEQGITFDDLLIVPQYSDVESRSQVDISTTIAGMLLKIPIVASNMDTICEDEMAIAIGKLGGLGIMHRFESIENRMRWVENCLSSGVHAVPSVGVDSESHLVMKMFFDIGADSVCIDVAHGNCKKVETLITTFYSKYKEYRDKQLIVGNFASLDLDSFFAKDERLTLKIGVGPGSACETRIVAGVGVPQATAILDIAGIASGKIIADGGIKKPADAAKAIGLGADAIMVGGFIAGTDEAPPRGRKMYRGMASFEAQIEHRGGVSNNVPEGKMFSISESGPVSRKIEKLVGGIRSAMSYTGAHNVIEYQSKVIFQRVSQATLSENIAHFKED